MLPYSNVALGGLFSASRALKMFLISKVHWIGIWQTVSLNSIISVKLKGDPPAAKPIPK